ncbi:hypothetical protein ACET3Z_017971 [Daucus carota]
MANGHQSDSSDTLSHVSDLLSPSEEALSESWFRSWSTPSDNEMLDIIDRLPLDGPSYANGFLIEAPVVEEEDFNLDPMEEEIEPREWVASGEMEALDCPSYANGFFIDAPVVEEEDFNLYPMEEEIERERRWSEACGWFASGEMEAKARRCLPPYFIHIRLLGADALDRHRRFVLRPWDGGELVNVERIAEISNLRPRETRFQKDQFRIAYVKEFVHNLQTDNLDDKPNPFLLAKFRLYDGSESILVSLGDDTKDHPMITTGEVREGSVLVLYQATCFISMDETPHHQLSIGYSNILGIFN